MSILFWAFTQTASLPLVALVTLNGKVDAP